MAFKAARMCEAVLDSQDEAITRKLKRQETESDNDKQALDDIHVLGYQYNNANLYISNQVVIRD